MMSSGKALLPEGAEKYEKERRKHKYGCDWQLYGIGQKTKIGRNQAQRMALCSLGRPPSLKTSNSKSTAAMVTTIAS